MRRSKWEIELEDAVGETIKASKAVGGGCIADARIVTLESGHSLFVKTYAGKPEMYACEANGLRELAAANAIRVPTVIAQSDSLLAMEHIVPGPRRPDFMADFGRRVARLHRSTQPWYGYTEDNFIGTTRQKNCPQAPIEDGWTHFFWHYRLRYQLQLAEANGHCTPELVRLMASLEERLDTLLGGIDEPSSLLHGDLWSGNFMTGPDGDACLIDPAVYYGHRETDLAMTRLFSSFGDDFYRAYEEEWPLQPGHRDRLPVYQLYHVLNHLNLFGGAYYSQSIQLLRQCCA